MGISGKFLFAVALLAASGTAGAETKKGEVWVYTSIYKEFAAPLKEAFEAAHPGVEAQIFQAGSEKIQAKVEAELLAKKCQADIILTSDPFWGLDLQQRGLAWNRPGRPAIETNYYSLMVMVAHKNYPAGKRPQAFTDLARPEYKDLVQIGSPLESGTTFTTVAYLSKKYGWDFFQKLRGNSVASAGGNSTVIQKVESGEKQLGVALLENVLAAQKRGSPIEVIYPSDGAIPIPSVQIILKDAPNRAAAAQFADFVMSEAGQRILRSGYMYPAVSTVPAPDGARPLADVTAKSTPWTTENQREVAAAAKDIKKKFTALILE